MECGYVFLWNVFVGEDVDEERRHSRDLLSLKRIWMIKDHIS